jgi:hypothetical protein
MRRFGQKTAMKRISLATLLLLTVPAHAADWVTYENPRYAFTVEVPGEGWEAQPEPGNGDGRTWYSTDGRSVIKVWATVPADGFAADARAYVATAKEQGWTITSDLDFNIDLAQGPDAWHVFSASLDGRSIQQKGLPICGGSRAIYARLEFFESEFVEFLPITDRLLNALKPVGDGCGGG